MHSSAAVTTTSAVRRRMPAGRRSGSPRRTSVRSSKSAKVRRRGSHSGHSQPTNTEMVSSRWATSLAQQSPHSGGGPVRAHDSNPHQGTSQAPTADRRQYYPVRPWSAAPRRPGPKRLTTTTRCVAAPPTRPTSSSPPRRGRATHRRRTQLRECASPPAHSALLLQLPVWPRSRRSPPSLGHLVKLRDPVLALVGHHRHP